MEIRVLDVTGKEEEKYNKIKKLFKSKGLNVDRIKYIIFKKGLEEVLKNPDVKKYMD